MSLKKYGKIQLRTRVALTQYNRVSVQDRFCSWKPKDIFSTNQKACSQVGYRESPLKSCAWCVPRPAQPAAATRKGSAAEWAGTENSQPTSSSTTWSNLPGRTAQKRDAKLLCWLGRTWVPISFWWRNGSHVQRCWRRSSSPLRPRQVQCYEEPSSSMPLLPTPCQCSENMSKSCLIIRWAAF